LANVHYTASYINAGGLPSVRDIRPLSARCTTNVGGAVGEFFSTTPTVSCEMLSQKPSSIALSANNRSVQRAWPWGAVEQAKAVILARAAVNLGWFARAWTLMQS
jgi:hypothetical protein